jgi:hypothetical protein
LHKLNLKNDAVSESVQEYELKRDEVNDFTEVTLKEVWLAFADKIKNDMPRMSQVLKEQVPMILPGYQLKFIITNAAQEKFIRENLYNKLMDYLVEKLKNTSINLLIEVGEPEQKEQVIYLSSDKYNYLSNLNPALNKLKKNFNLELE